MCFERPRHYWQDEGSSGPPLPPPHCAISSPPYLFPSPPSRTLPYLLLISLSLSHGSAGRRSYGASARGWCCTQRTCTSGSGMGVVLHPQSPVVHPGRRCRRRRGRKPLGPPAPPHLRKHLRPRLRQGPTVAWDRGRSGAEAVGCGHTHGGAGPRGRWLGAAEAAAARRPSSSTHDALARSRGGTGQRVVVASVAEDGRQNGKRDSASKGSSRWEKMPGLWKAPCIGGGNGLTKKASNNNNGSARTGSRSALQQWHGAAEARAAARGDAAPTPSIFLIFYSICWVELWRGPSLKIHF